MNNVILNTGENKAHPNGLKTVFMHKVCTESAKMLKNESHVAIVACYSYHS